eukprot:4556783-Pyramimonas_sp.AAC.1
MRAPLLGAFGGAPYGATKRVRGVEIRMQNLLLGASGGAPCGAAMRVRGVENHMRPPFWGLWWSFLGGREA